MDKKGENLTKVFPEKAGETIAPKQDVAYPLISRNLTEKNLRDIAVVKLIILDRDRLQAENTELKEWEKKFHETDKLNGILNNKLKTYTAFEIISTGTIAVGSLLAGFAFNPFNITLFILGIILIIVGIIAKTIKII